MLSLAMTAAAKPCSRPAIACPTRGRMGRMRAVDRLGSTTGSPRPCDAGAVRCRGRTCSMLLRLRSAMSGTDMQTVAVLNWCVAVSLTLALAHSLSLTRSFSLSPSLSLSRLLSLTVLSPLLSLSLPLASISSSQNSW